MKRHPLCFLPDEFHARKARRKSNTLCAALFLCVMTAIGAAYAVSERSLRRIEAEHASVEKEFDLAAARVAQVRQLQDQQRRLAYQTDVAASLVDKLPRSYVLAEVTNALPPGVSLAAFELDTPAAAAGKYEKPHAPDVRIRLAGLAETDVQVSQFLDKLTRSSVLRDIDLLPSPDSAAVAQSTRRFSMTLSLEPAGTAVDTPSFSTLATELLPE